MAAREGLAFANQCQTKIPWTASTEMMSGVTGKLYNARMKRRRQPGALTVTCWLAG